MPSIPPAVQLRSSLILCAALLGARLAAQTVVPLSCPADGMPFHAETFGPSDSTWFMHSSEAIALPDMGAVLMTQEPGPPGNGVRLTRTDALGHTVWSYAYVDAAATSALPTAFTRTAAGDLLVAGCAPGYTNAWDIFLLKVDANGNVLWYKTYSAARSFYVTDVAEGVNGTIAIVGMDYYLYTAGWIGTNPWETGYDPARNAAIALVTDASGGILSFTPYAFDFNNAARVWEIFYDVEPLSGGGFLVTGNSGHDWDNIFAMVGLRLDDNGAQQWIRFYGYDQWSVTGWNSADGKAVCQDSPTTAVFAGHVSDYIQYGSGWSYYNASATRIDLATGNVLWGWRYPYLVTDPCAVKAGAGHVFIAASTSDAEAATVAGGSFFELDATTGQLLQAKSYDSAPFSSRPNGFRTLDRFSNGELLFAGYNNDLGRADAWLLHTDANGDGTCQSGPITVGAALPMNWSDVAMEVNSAAIEGVSWADAIPATAVDRTLERTCVCIRPVERCASPVTARFTLVHDTLCPGDSLRILPQLPDEVTCGGTPYNWQVVVNGAIVAGQIVGGQPLATAQGDHPLAFAVPVGADSLQVRLVVLDCAGAPLCSAAAQAMVRHQVAASFDLGNDTTLCATGLSIGPSPAPGHTYTWFTGALGDTWPDVSATASIGQNVPFTASTSGSYFLLDDNGGCTAMDSIRLVLDHLDLEVLDTTYGCVGDTVMLDATWTPTSTYLWSPPAGATSATVTVTTAGTYLVHVHDQGCSGVDSATVVLRPPPVMDLPATASLCIDVGYAELLVPAGFDSVRWDNGATTALLHVSTEGTFTAMGWSNGCASARDSIRVYRMDCSCPLYLPNSFTPDGDGVNDAWGPVVDCALRSLELTVFDRWGTPLLTLTAQGKVWDGMYGGQACPIGVYPYKLAYSVERPDEGPSQRVERFGHVTLVR